MPQGINDRTQVVGFFLDNAGIHGFLYDRGRFSLLDAPLGLDPVFQGINNRNQIVGSFQDASGSHGFFFDRGLFTTIDILLPDTFDTFVTGINELGEMVGGYQTGVFPVPTGVRSFVYSHGVFTTIHVPNEINSSAKGINNRGQIVGEYVGTGPINGFRGYLATPQDE